MLVASIDVGIVNLAVAFVEVDSDTYQLTRIVRVENVDSTKFEHGTVCYDACTLGHTKTATDRIMHFIQERAALFDTCARILIERQPIQGHTDVEQLLYMVFRDKAELVSPNSMHKLLNIGHLTYEWRKVKTVEFADTMLDPITFHEYHSMERRHDIADALCLLIYWAYSHHTAPSKTPGALQAGGREQDARQAKTKRVPVEPCPVAQAWPCDQKSAGAGAGANAGGGETIAAAGAADATREDLPLPTPKQNPPPCNPFAKFVYTKRERT